LRLEFVGKTLCADKRVTLLLECTLDCADGAGEFIDTAVDGRQVAVGSAGIRRCHVSGLGSGHCIFS